MYINIYTMHNWYCRKFKEKFDFSTPYWSMISSLLHLLGLSVTKNLLLPILFKARLLDTAFNFVTTLPLLLSY